MGKQAIISGLVFALLAGGAACGGDDEDTFEQAPIVFLHGCPPPPINNKQVANLWTGGTQGTPETSAFQFYRDKGYPEDYLNLFVYDGATCPPNFDYAAEVATYIDEVIARTNRQRIDLVTISMGALAGRIYIKQSGGELVEDFVSIVGANHGSILAGMVGEAGQSVRGYPYWEGAFESFPMYACDGEAGPDAQFREEFPSDSEFEQPQFFVNGCLTAEGKSVEEDETPFDVDEGGHIRYLSIWNDLDDLVSPPESSCLNSKFQGDCSDPVNLMFTVTAMHELIPESGVYSSHVETEFYQPSRDAVYEFITAPR